MRQWGWTASRVRIMGRVSLCCRLDNTYVGETRLRHELLLSPAPGQHTLTVVDDEGNTAFVRFTIAD